MGMSNFNAITYQFHNNPRTKKLKQNKKVQIMTFSLLDKIMMAVLVGMVIFGLGSGYKSADLDLSEIKNLTIEKPKQTSISLFLFAEGININTPAYRKEWLPLTDCNDGKHVFLLEDIPFLGWETLIPVAIAIFLSLVITRLFKNFFSFQENGLTGLFYTIILFVFLIIIAIALWHLLWFKLTTLGGEGLGMSREAVIQARNDVLNATEPALIPMFAISLISFLSALKIFSGGDE